MAQGKQTTRTDADVLVVGGGLAGLQAAATVRAHGLVPLVIEAGHELGGRARSGRAGSVAVDFGGEWFGRRHVRLTALARRFNLEVQPAGQLGHPVLWRLGERESVGACRHSRWPEICCARFGGHGSSRRVWTP